MLRRQENIVKEGIVLETRSGLTKHASSEIEYIPQEPYKLPNIAREIGAAELYKPNILMNKSAGAYGSLPPSLTESESDGKSEPESDQEHTAEEANRHKLREGFKKKGTNLGHCPKFGYPLPPLNLGHP